MKKNAIILQMSYQIKKLILFMNIFIHKIIVKRKILLKYHIKCSYIIKTMFKFMNINLIKQKQ